MLRTRPRTTMREPAARIEEGTAPGSTAMRARPSSHAASRSSWDTGAGSRPRDEIRRPAALFLVSLLARRRRVPDPIGHGAQVARRDDEGAQVPAPGGAVHPRQDVRTLEKAGDGRSDVGSRRDRGHAEMVGPRGDRVGEQPRRLVSVHLEPQRRIGQAGEAPLQKHGVGLKLWVVQDAGLEVVSGRLVDEGDPVVGVHGDKSAGQADDRPPQVQEPLRPQSVAQLADRQGTQRIHGPGEDRPSQLPLAGAHVGGQQGRGHPLVQGLHPRRHLSQNALHVGFRVAGVDALHGQVRPQKVPPRPAEKFADDLVSAGGLRREDHVVVDARLQVHQAALAGEAVAADRLGQPRHRGGQLLARAAQEDDAKGDRREGPFRQERHHRARILGLVQAVDHPTRCQTVR
ncbi:hypothetical protein VTK73DRAFT_5438 [Phialemonium thermophilum]|uniref:Uncharacterized protein n=1 Tax=Phialemonium thermophilum TaxID=223376 RepID=A0ABR3V293_9PEZI